MKNLIYLAVSFACLSLISCSKDGASISSSSSTGGSSNNGSLTRFITVGNYLYTVDLTSLKTFDISNPATPILKGSIDVGFNIETVLAYRNNLFIGSNQNMFIYSIANPELPVKQSQVAYFVRGRDPIAVKDSMAYSTVRGFNGGGTLNIFNVNVITNPRIVGIVNLQNPYGLGIKDSAMYICEGQFGLKVFSIKNPSIPSIRKEISNSEIFYDVIVENNILFCFIKGGIYMYDISSIFNPIFISSVKN